VKSIHLSLRAESKIETQNVSEQFKTSNKSIFFENLITYRKSYYKNPVKISYIRSFVLELHQKPKSILWKIGFA